MKKSHEVQIIFFDGVCNLCNGFVDFVMRFDRHHQFQFASLQGETAKKLLPEKFHQELSTVVLLKDGKVNTKATAVLLVLQELGAVWKFFWIFNYFPFKDFFYNLIAKNRYCLFGKRKSCRLPTDEEAHLFLK